MAHSAPYRVDGCASDDNAFAFDVLAEILGCCSARRLVFEEAHGR